MCNHRRVRDEEMAPTPGAAGLRLMHVHAHPDDESSKGAATMAYYVAQGARVMVVTCTGGELGDILNPAMNTPTNRLRLAQLRRSEMAEAARILGIEHEWLGFHDSGFQGVDDPALLAPDSFAAQDVDTAAGRLVRVIRSFRPHVVTTYDEGGGYPHPDHIMTHKVTIAALDAAADPAQWPDDGSAWVVPKLYYDMTLNGARFAALDAAMRERGLASWAEALPPRRLDEKGARVTTRIRCGQYFETRNRALRAHRTQIDPNDAFFFGVPLDVQQASWPTEDFQLVRSLVPITLPETDLFAGLRGGGSDVDWKPDSVPHKPSSTSMP